MGKRSHRMNRRLRRTFELLENRHVLAATVVINEIHYNPVDSQSLSEFVELHNASDLPVDISAWSISDGVDYRVPPETVLPPHGFYVVAENVSGFAAEFNAGEGPYVAYQIAAGTRGLQTFGGPVGMDFVVHSEILVRSLGAFDSSSDGFGRSITVQLWERNDGGTPGSPNDDTGQRVLAELVFSNASPGELEGGTRFKDLEATLVLAPGSYTIVASGYGTGERLLNGGAEGAGDVEGVAGRISFVGSSRWGNDSATFPQNIDMHPHQYAAGSFRYDFATQISLPRADGQYAGKLSNSGETLVLRNAAGAVADEVTYKPGFPWPTAADGAGPSMELIHPLLDNDLGGSWRSAGNGLSGQPSPGHQNSVFSDVAAPQIRQVQVTPQQPISGQVVVLTAKVTDPDGVASVNLAYQVVRPGDYIRQSDSRYETEWQLLPMRDDGVGADIAAGDDVYSVGIPSEVQVHRHLVRYRITASDHLGQAVRTPYADDEQGNFAYFVYDGIPEWTGADRPGHTEPVTYDTDVTRSLPAFHLLSRESDVLASNFDTRYNTTEFRFEATLVAGGEVYDHIRYRIRGQYSTYVAGKNKWKLKFLRGHEFQGYDQYGTPWPEELRTLNFGTAASPWAPANRGLAGMDEALAFRLFNMAGVAAPHASPFQLRVIDSQEEAPARSQYEGDLWGLYLAFENPSGDFLRSHDLPDGNLFRMQNTASELENHGFGLPGNLSDLNAFTSTRTGYNLSPSQSVSWWREHVDLEGYYGYRSVVEAVNHSDIRDRENMLLFFNPETEKWSMLPWDVDLLYEEFDRWGPEGVQSASPLEQFRKALVHDELMIEFQNRARELQDLLLNDDQGAQVVEEYARYVEPFAAIDRAMWDYHPRVRQSPANGQHYGAFYREVYRYPAGNGAAGQVRRAISPVGFEGMVNWVKEFISQDGFGGGRLEGLARDPQIPDTPTVSYQGSVGFPAADLTFRASEFRDPQGDDTFAGLQWRLGQVRNPTTPGYVPSEPWRYEIDDVWTSGIVGQLDPQITVPATAVSIGQTYRVRVRYLDGTGRWSHWSEPTEFVAGEALQPADPGLRISEIHYHPGEPTAAEIFAGFDGADDFEFLELLNVADQPIELSGVELRRTAEGQGVSFSFADSPFRQLLPGQSVVIVEDAEAFQFRYGDSNVIAGQWSGGLSNSGETLQLFVNATPVLEFAYDDAWYHETDGEGYSLELATPYGTGPGQSGFKEAWRPSVQRGGSPGSIGGALAGDANRDGLFNSSDLIQVFQYGEYEDNRDNNSTWEEGDWNGDGDFDSADTVIAFQLGRYEAVPGSNASKIAAALVGDNDCPLERRISISGFPRRFSKRA